MVRKKQVAWQEIVDSDTAMMVQFSIENIIGHIQDQTKGLRIAPAGVRGYAITLQGLMSISKSLEKACGLKASKDRPTFLLRFVGSQGTIPLAYASPAWFPPGEVEGWYVDGYNACCKLWDLLQARGETIALATARAIIEEW